MAAFQDAMHDNFCWGCGADNPDGLQLKTEWDGDRTISRWTGAPRFAAGPRHVLNGGIIATLLDCHGVCSAMAASYRRAGREIGTSPEMWRATTLLEVEYLRPTPIDAEIVLRGEIIDGGTRVECVLSADDKDRARARVTSVQVPDSWRQGRAG